MVACSGSDRSTGGENRATASNASPGTEPARSNVEELGILINVPYESEEAFWKEDPAAKRLIAVLRFPAAETSRLVADAEKLKPAGRASIDSETWFPPELIAQSEMSGEDKLEGTSYAADAFIQAPYTEGRIIRIDGTDYFVLEAFAK